MTKHSMTRNSVSHTDREHVRAWARIRLARTELLALGPDIHLRVERLGMAHQELLSLSRDRVVVERELRKLRRERDTEVDRGRSELRFLHDQAELSDPSGEAGIFAFFPEQLHGRTVTVPSALMEAMGVLLVGIDSGEPHPFSPEQVDALRECLGRLEQSVRIIADLVDRRNELTSLQVAQRQRLTQLRIGLDESVRGTLRAMGRNAQELAHVFGRRPEGRKADAVAQEPEPAEPFTVMPLPLEPAIRDLAG